MENHQDGRIFHKCAFKTVLESTHQLPTHYLMAQNELGVCGVLPLGHLKSRLFSNALISTPFCVQGSVLADNEDVANALMRAAHRKACELNVDYLEYRSISPMPLSNLSSLYVNFKREIFLNEEDNLKAIPRKQRAVVRKGIKGNYTTRINRDLDLFYRLFSESQRNLGTPVQSKKWFESLLNAFPEQTDILSVFDGQKPVCSVLSFYDKSTVYPYYGGGSVQARAGANDYMYWSLMLHALFKGCQWFDFGRSKVDSGSYRFKKHWGFNPEPLYYYYDLIQASTQPNINPNNPKYQWLIRQWKRLPLPVANTIGPYIARNLG